MQLDSGRDPLESPVGRAIIVHGTDEQRARLLPSTTSGQERYCVGFSEPAHGSDLASVETCGQVDGGEIAVSGTKAWVAHADRASAIFVLCRTEPTAPRFRNLSCVVVPLRDNQVELRPVRQMSGDDGFFHVHLDAARAPLGNVIGGRGNGWRVAMSTLAFARATTGQVALEREFWELVETARRYGRDRDPLVRQHLAWAYAQVRMLHAYSLRTPSPSEAETSLIKLLGSEYHRRLGEIALDVAGADALVRPEGEAYTTSPWQHVFLSSRAETIAGGTSEMQRTLIAERVLGLPK
jgi:alkylation response protein AidB-like acyl-CoA dehydrogenase